MTTNPEWECVICYENGITTGQVTLACKHTVCLGCYTSMGSYRSSPTCPCCRSVINTGQRPLAEISSEPTFPDHERQELMRLANRFQVYYDFVMARHPPVNPMTRIPAEVQEAGTPPPQR